MKFLAYRFLVLFVSIGLVAAMTCQAAASEFWDDNISEEAIVFVENVWVFSGDCSDGVFSDSPALFVQSLRQVWGLYDLIPETDRELLDVIDAKARLQDISDEYAESLSDSVSTALVIRCAASFDLQLQSELRNDGVARILTGLFCVTVTAISLFNAVRERPVC